MEAGVQLWPRNARVSLQHDAACALVAPGSEHPPDVVKVVIPWPRWELGYWQSTSRPLRRDIPRGV